MKLSEFNRLKGGTHVLLDRNSPRIARQFPGRQGIIAKLLTAPSHNHVRVAIKSHSDGEGPFSVIPADIQMEVVDMQTFLQLMDIAVSPIATE